MQIVEVDLDALSYLHAHEGEALGGQAVGLVDVAPIPLYLAEGAPWVVGHCVETTAERHAARSWRTVRMVIGCVDVRMVVEVLVMSVTLGASWDVTYLLQMDNVVSTLGELGADGVSIGSLVAGNPIVGKKSRQTGDVVCQEVKCTRGLRCCKLSDKGQEGNKSGGHCQREVK